MTNNNGTYCPILKLTVTAGEDIPAFRFVSYAGMLCTGDEYPIGITETDWSAGDTMSVIALGTAIVKMSGDIAAGDHISTSADGIGIRTSSEKVVAAIAVGSVSATGFATVKLIV